MSFDEMKAELLEQANSNRIIQCTAHTPYDGCWYEMNYWLWKSGDLYPIYISGPIYTDKLGFKGFALAEETPWLNAMPSDKWFEWMSHRQDKYNDWEVIDPEEWELDDYNKLNIATAILSQHEVHTPKWTCSICHEECVGLAKFLGYRGNGGIGVNIDDPCCKECFYKLRWCNSCYKYVTDYDELDGEEEEDEYGDFQPTLICANYDPEESEKHELSEATDEAEQFGLTGYRFLGPDGDAEGLEGVCIMIATKRLDPTSEV